MSKLLQGARGRYCYDNVMGWTGTENIFLSEFCFFPGKAAFRFLKDELNRLRSVGVEGLPVNLDEWSRDNRAAMPLQDNGFDCGMFVIVDANFLSHHLALDFTQTWLSFVSASH